MKFQHSVITKNKPSGLLHLTWSLPDFIMNDIRETKKLCGAVRLGWSSLKINKKLEVYSSQSHMLQYQTSYLQVPIVTSYWHRVKYMFRMKQQHRPTLSWEWWCSLNRLYRAFSGNASGPQQARPCNLILKPDHEHEGLPPVLLPLYRSKLCCLGFEEIQMQPDTSSTNVAVSFSLPIRTSCCTLYIKTSFQRRESKHFFCWRLAMYIMTREVRSKDLTAKAHKKSAMAWKCSLKTLACKTHASTLAETSLQVFKASGAFLTLFALNSGTDENHPSQPIYRYNTAAYATAFKYQMQLCKYA